MVNSLLDFVGISKKLSNPFLFSQTHDVDMKFHASFSLCTSFLEIAEVSFKLK